MKPEPTVKEPGLRIFLAARGLSVLGDGITAAVLGFAVLAAGRPGDLAAIFLAQTIAMFLFSFLGGTVGDRVSRIRVMVSADIASALCVGGAAIVLMLDGPHVGALCVLFFVNGIALSFFRPSLGGIMPLLLQTPSNLKQANAQHSFVYYSCISAGPLLGGALLSVVPPAEALLIDASTFLVSAACLSRITLRPTDRLGVGDPRSSTIVRSTTDGIKFVLSIPWLLAGIVMSGLYQFVSGGFVPALGPLILTSRPDGQWIWATLLSAGGIGSIVGSPIARRLPLRNAFAAKCVASLFSIPALVAIGWDANAVTIVALFFLAGVTATVAETFWETLVQSAAPVSMLSRISSAEWTLESSLRMAGLGLAIPIYTALGATLTFAAAALCLVLVYTAPMLAQATGLLRIPQIERSR